MPYSAIASRRMPYDIDGTVVGYRLWGEYASGIQNWADPGIIANLNFNGIVSNIEIGGNGNCELWFFFPEKREIELIGILVNSDYSYLIEVQGSNDTTNGIDGVWETANFSNGLPNTTDRSNVYWWRTNIKPISFSTSYKVIRIKLYIDTSYTESVGMIHLYGRKAAGEIPDDILFCDTNGNELTALKDWGDRPEGTTVIDSFKIKNASTTKIANNVNLQLNHADFGLSLSENGPWTATLDITSIAANSLSSTIYIRNLLGPPLLALGPKAARCIATVGSFT